MGDLRFDPERHSYTLDGVAIPGITAVLRGAGLIDETWFSAASRDRGTAVHLATQFADEGDLDEGSVDPALLGYIAAWNAFKAEAGFTATYPPEILVGSPTLRYATQIDRVGTLDGGFLALNIKTGMPQPWHPVQTAGEALAFCEWTGAARIFNLRRASVQLSDDGTYRFHEHKNRRDYDVFRAARVVAQWKADTK